MRWVLITPFGAPVDPDVKSTLATVSGPTRACASSTAAVAVVARSAAKAVCRRKAGAGLLVTTSTSSGSARLASARSKRSPSAAKISPGRIAAQTAARVRWSCETSE